MKNIKSSFSIVIISVLLIHGTVLAHSGGTNSSGCHNDNIHGGYHCHNSGSTGGNSNDYSTPTKKTCGRDSYISNYGSCLTYPEANAKGRTILKQATCPLGQFSVGDKCMPAAQACLNRHGSDSEYSNDGECWCKDGYSFIQGYCKFINTAQSGRDETVERIQRRLQEKTSQNTTVIATVVRIVDGDTIEVSLDDVKEKVRIIGIDTPETVHPRKEVQCFGREASAKLKELIEGTGVQLQSNPAEDKDRYGRLLRYIEFRNEDIGARMIREGYAYSYKEYPHPHLDEYNKLEIEAREANRGLWGSCDNEGHEVAPSNSNKEFSDVKDAHPYMQAIRWGKSSRVLKGYPDGTFQPDKTVNRAEFLKIVLEGKGVDVDSATSPTKFTDVDENGWYAPYVRYAKAQGIIQGYGDGSFRPSQPVNFAEALKMAYVALGVESIETGGEWYERYLRHAKKNTVLFSDNVNVGAGMSRKDVVWIVYKMMNHTGDWRQPEADVIQQSQQNVSDTNAKPLNIGHIRFNPYWTNWDSDAEDDGFEVSPYFKDVDGIQVYPNSRDWSATIRIYNADRDYSKYKDFDAHKQDLVQEIRFSGTDVKYQGLLETPYVRVGREQFPNLQPSEDWVILEAEFSSPTYGTFAAQDQQTSNFRTR